MNERWMKDMQDRFADFEKPAPEGLFADVQREMQRRGLTPVEEKRGRTIPMWVRGAAVAASLAVVLGVGLLMVNGLDGMNGIDGQTLTQTLQAEQSLREGQILQPKQSQQAGQSLQEGQSLAEVQSSRAGQSLQEKQILQQEETQTLSIYKRNDLLAEEVEIEHVSPVANQEVVSGEDNEETTEIATSEVPTTSNQSGYQVSEKDIDQRSTLNGQPFSRDKDLYWMRKGRQRKKWEIGANITGMQGLSSPSYKYLAYANALSYSDQAYFDEHVGVGSIDVGTKHADAETASQPSTANYSNTSSNFATTRASNSSIVFVNKQLQRMYVDAHHRQPVKVGVSLRYHFNNKWSVQAGIDYSYHSSDLIKQIDNSQIQGEQKLHFVGVPVTLAYSLWNLGRFNFYLSAGGEVEKVIKGTQTTKSLTSNLADLVDREDVKEKPWQFSVMGSGGVQFNVNSLLSIYAEPGVGYYFDNKSNLPTIYQEKPFNFNLNMGIRFNINE